MLHPGVRAVLATCVASCACATGPTSHTAHTACGPVLGTDFGDGLAFFGIRYAAAPVGSQRWQPPTPASCWNGTLDATVPGPMCLQHGRFVGSANQAMDEDCLRVSVFTQAVPGGGSQDGSSLRPIVVWLHGGDLIEGSSLSIQSGYGAIANLTAAPTGAVVVGVEYRLGVAGFLALDALAERDVRGLGLVGNYGLLDVVEALRWVQRNGAAFGGDPGRVTVAGQSSGGSLVFALLASPLSHGLMHRAYSLSGSPRLDATTADASGTWHREVPARTRCANLSASTAPPLADCLLGLSGAELVAALPPDWSTDGWGLQVFERTHRYAPLLLVDGPGGALPHDYLSAHRLGRTLDIPTLIGVTRQEGDFSPGADVRNQSAAQFAALLNGTFASYGEELTRQILGLYVPATAAAAASSPATAPSFEAQRAYSELITDATTLCPNFLLASAIAAAHNSPVFVYALAQTTAAPFCPLEPFNRFRYCPEYAFHAADEFLWMLPHFGEGVPGPAYRWAAEDHRFAGLMGARLASFIHDGDVPAWRSFLGETAARPGPRAGRNDSLPSEYVATDLRLLPGDLPTPRLKAEECELWLANGFYEVTAPPNLGGRTQPKGRAAEARAQARRREQQAGRHRRVGRQAVPRARAGGKVAIHGAAGRAARGARLGLGRRDARARRERGVQCGAARAGRAHRAGYEHRGAGARGARGGGGARRGARAARRRGGAAAARGGRHARRRAGGSLGGARGAGRGAAGGADLS